MAPLPAAVVGVALSLPSIFSGSQLDDHIHRAIISGSVLGVPTTPSDLFRFVDGNPERTHILMDIGVLPWWTVPEVRIAFLRPLAVLTHLVDYRLWPDDSRLAHLHSVAWYFILVLLVGCLYRRVLGTTRAAGLAVLLFAVDDAHGMTVGWIANRNALIGMCFGVAALVVHHEATRAAGLSFLGPVLFLMSLLASEGSIVTLGYIGAHAVVLDGRCRRRRTAAFVPYVVVASGWAVAYRLLGFGSWGSGIYRDPIQEPWTYVQAATWRIPVLLLAELAFPPSDVVGIVVWGWWLVTLVLAAIVFLALSAAVAWPLLRQHAPARFFVAVLLLGVVPASATFPSDRLLLMAGLGGAGLVALWLDVGWSRRSSNRLLGGLVTLYAFVHAVAAPALLPVRSMSFAMLGTALEAQTRGVDDGGASSVVLVNPLSEYISTYLPLLRTYRAEPVPPRIRCLGLGLRRMHIERKDANTLVVMQEGGLLLTPWETLMRGPSHPMQPGEAINLSDVKVTVLAVTPDGRPLTTEFRFDRALEDGSIAWYVAGGWTLQPWCPPPVGASVELPGIP